MMEFKRLPDKVITKAIKQVEIEGMVFNATGEFYNLLDELSDCDGFFTHLVIDDDALVKNLVKLGITSVNIKGSYAPKNKAKLEELKNIICEVAYG